jgi:hypothetical protein
MNEEKTFNEYYEYYLTLHQNKTNRWLHVLGQCVTLTVLFHALTTQNWFLLLIVPFVIYPFAWTGHFFFEKNKPAAWSRPLWAKACDWLMFKDIIIGKIK